ncbi:MAG: site-2 protease family protein, partial [Candidatus Colwellbacteria bacterium]|nr:site-2 protease family protein [Candidatus Colwellbacteria bacterium]
IAVIAVLIIVHEFGHFVTAKRAGMKVEEFGFGFPPRLWGIKRGETTYSINLVPFGGFVKIFGEDGEHRNEARSFSSKPVAARLKVVVAGVAMNFLLAVFLLMIGNYAGIRVGIGDEMDDIAAQAKDKAVQIVSVVEGSPAQKADLHIFDEIAGFQDASGKMLSVLTSQEVRDYVVANAGKEINIVIKRNSTFETKSVALPEKDEGNGLLGIIPARTGILSYPWYESIWRGLSDAVSLAFNTVIGYYQLFKTLILKGELISDVSGPIGIANVTGQAARVGFRFLLQFVALISINLAVLNIIPFPALDGGRGLMILIEKLKGSPVGSKVESVINSVGFAFLILLMVYATIKDIGRFF